MRSCVTERRREDTGWVSGDHPWPRQGGVGYGPWRRDVAEWRVAEPRRPQEPGPGPVPMLRPCQRAAPDWDPQCPVPERDVAVTWEQCVRPDRQRLGGEGPDLT